MQRCGVTKPASKTTNPRLYIMNAWKTFHIILHVLYTITLRNFVVPTRSVWWEILFRETGVVQ